MCGWMMAESWLHVLPTFPVYGHHICERPPGGAGDPEQVVAQKFWVSPLSCSVAESLSRPRDIS